MSASHAVVGLACMGLTLLLWEITERVRASARRRRRSPAERRLSLDAFYASAGMRQSLCSACRIRLSTPAVDLEDQERAVLVAARGSKSGRALEQMMSEDQERATCACPWPNVRSCAGCSEVTR